MAAQHDSVLLVNAGVLFDSVLLKDFVSRVSSEKLESSNKSRNSVDFVGLLGGLGAVAVCNGDVLSGQWFSNKFSGPFYKNVFFDSVDLLVSEFNLILLRDIVFGLALESLAASAVLDVASLLAFGKLASSHLLH